MLPATIVCRRSGSTLPDSTASGSAAMPALNGAMLAVMVELTNVPTPLLETRP